MSWKDFLPTDLQGLGALVTIVLAVAGSIAAILKYFVGQVRGFIRKEFEPIREENQRLRDELENRLRFPQYATEIIGLSEKVVELKVSELQAEHARSLAEKDEETSVRLETRLRELEQLRTALTDASREREDLISRLQGAVIADQPKIAPNAVGLPTSRIMLVRFKGTYGALQAIDQAGTDRGAFIRYTWWYRGDQGSGKFVGSGVETGVAEAREGGTDEEARLRVGPIALYWSTGGNGFGWVYFGPSTTASNEYELVLTNETDIFKVDAAQYVFVGPSM